MAQFLQICVVTQKMLVNINCPRQMTPSCADQILSDKQHGSVRVWKHVLKQERCLKVLESILHDCVDQWQLEGQHDFCHP